MNSSDLLSLDLTLYPLQLCRRPPARRCFSTRSCSPSVPEPLRFLSFAFSHAMSLCVLFSSCIFPPMQFCSVIVCWGCRGCCVYALHGGASQTRTLSAGWARASLSPSAPAPPPAAPKAATARSPSRFVFESRTPTPLPNHLELTDIYPTFCDYF